METMISEGGDKTSMEVHKEGREARRLLNALNSAQEIDQKEKILLQTRVKLAEALRVMEDQGLKFKMMADGPKNALAWVYGNSEQVGFVTRKTLLTRDKTELTIIAAHEKKHKLSGVFEIDLEQELNPVQIEELSDAVDEIQFQDVNLVEGLTQRSVEHHHGKMDDCAYTHHEVPIANRLEKLSRAFLNESLQSHFDDGDQEGIYDLLRNLADCLAVRGALRNVYGSARGGMDNQVVKKTADRVNLN